MNVLMVGPGRDVQGGISTVVNQYYEGGLDKQVNLKYIESMKDGSKLKKLFVAICAYIEFCKEVSQAEIVHVHMSSRASFYRKSRFIKKAFKKHKKIILHLHSSEFDIFYEKECSNRQKKYVRHIFELADVVIALSERWKEYLPKIVNKEKILVVYNAVKLPDYFRNEYGNKNILFLGKLWQKKGIYDLLEAIPKILKEDPDIHFYLGGDGEVEKCKSICEDKGIQSNVTFLGWVRGEEKAKFLKECSTYVLPSYHEGIPMSILEAMSYGAVVVSTDVGGIPEVVHDHENGYIFHAGDINALQKCLLEAVSCEAKSKIGEMARMTVEKQFDINNSIRYLVKLYGDLVR